MSFLSLQSNEMRSWYLFLFVVLYNLTSTSQRTIPFIFHLLGHTLLLILPVFMGNSVFKFQYGLTVKSNKSHWSFDFFFFFCTIWEFLDSYSFFYLFNQCDPEFWGGKPFNVAFRRPSLWLSSLTPPSGRLRLRRTHGTMPRCCW